MGIGATCGRMKVSRAGSKRQNALCAQRPVDPSQGRSSRVRSAPAKSAMKGLSMTHKSRGSRFPGRFRGEDKLKAFSRKLACNHKVSSILFDAVSPKAVTQ